MALRSEEVSLSPSRNSNTYCFDLNVSVCEPDGKKGGSLLTSHPSSHVKWPAPATASYRPRGTPCSSVSVENDVTCSSTMTCFFLVDRVPSSYPSFEIRCPRALKAVCGRLEIVDRRDDHALISAAGHPRHHHRCHRTTIARRPATRTRGGRTEAQESRTAAHDVPVLPLACGLARRLALSRTLPWTMPVQWKHSSYSGSGGGGGSRTRTT